MAKTNSRKARSLPESDYLAILDAIISFHSCKTRSDLLNTIKEVILPIFNAQAALYIGTSPDFEHLARVIGHVGVPEDDLEVFCKLAPYNSFNKVMFENSRAVFAHDVDISRRHVKTDVARFFKANPQYDRKKYPYFDRFNSGLVIADMPEPTLAVALHRTDECKDVWTCRDVRVMELLRPHLIQAIKSVLLREELAQYKSLAEELADVPTPTALVNPDLRVTFRNRAFQDLLAVEPEKKLPQDLAEAVVNETARFEPPFQTDHSEMKISFYTLGKGVFRVSVVPLGGKPREGGKLVRLKPAVEPMAKMNWLLQEKGLTGREMEISVLLKDGIHTQEVADRLFISVHTLRTHLKNIYEKMGVHTRAQLAALLDNPVA